MRTNQIIAEQTDREMYQQVIKQAAQAISRNQLVVQINRSRDILRTGQLCLTAI